MYHQIVEQYGPRRFVEPDLDANYLQRLSADDIGRSYFSRYSFETSWLYMY